MDVNLLFKIAAVGILVTVIGQVLKHSGREEHAFLVSLAGLINKTSVFLMKNRKQTTNRGGRSWESFRSQ